MAELHVVDLEAAINWWRQREGATEGVALGPELRALAEVYGEMTWARVQVWPADALSPAARSAWLHWYATTPDTPCIAICSTSQGDAICKGCGRSFDEVQHWTAMDAFDKRRVWRRILSEGSAWRFNRYAERAGSPRPDEAGPEIPDAEGAGPQDR